MDHSLLKVDTAVEKVNERRAKEEKRADCRNREIASEREKVSGNERESKRKL